MNEIKVGDFVVYATKSLDSIEIRIGKVIKLNLPYKINLSNIISIGGYRANNGYNKYREDFSKMFLTVIKKEEKKIIIVSCFRTIVLSENQIKNYKNFFKE